jgi:hypothetical protein
MANQDASAPKDEPPKTAAAEATTGRRRIPSAPDFSPEQINLTRLLQAVRSGAGSRETVDASIAEAFPKIGASRARNPRIALGEYGLYDKASHRLSALGNQLLDLGEGATQDEVLAKHILSNLHGLDVLQAVHDLSLRGEKANKATLDAELRRRGFALAADTTRHIFMLWWLERAGVCSYDRSAQSWSVNDERLRDLVGISFADVDVFSTLSLNQRLFALTLKRIAAVEGTQPVRVSRVRRETEALYSGVAFKGALRERVIRPLAAADLLVEAEMQSAGKSGTVAATQRLIELDVDVAQRLSTGLVPPELRRRLNTPLTDVYQALSAGTKHERGLALELLALRMAYDVGLAPMGFRERSVDTGYAEVDLIAEGAHLMFSRWLFQCKATKTNVPLNDLAKEIGMATVLRAHVVVMVSLGSFSRDLVEHAVRISENTHLQVVLIDRRVLTAYRNRGSGALLEFLLDTAAETLRMKRAQVAGVI